MLLNCEIFLFLSECCHTIKLVLKNEPKDILENFDGLSLESFTGLYNKVGFVNGEKYWLSEDKKWAIYTCTDKNWIVGSVQGKVKIIKLIED